MEITEAVKHAKSLQTFISNLAEVGAVSYGSPKIEAINTLISYVESLESIKAGLPEKAIHGNECRYIRTGKEKNCDCGSFEYNNAIDACAASILKAIPEKMRCSTGLKKCECRYCLYNQCITDFKNRMGGKGNE